MRELAFAGTIEIRDVQIVEMLKVVGEVNHFPGGFVGVERVDAARTVRDRGKVVCGQIGTEDMRFAFDTGTEKNRIRSGPMQFSGNGIQILGCELRGRAARGIGDVEFRELVNGGLPGEKNLRAIRRPAGSFALEGVVGDFGERAAVGGNGPNVGVVAVVVGFAGAVGDEGDARTVGRPLRVEVVPVLPFGDLFRFAAGNADDPKVAALFVEPAGVVEVEADVRVMANVDAARGRACSLLTSSSI